MDLSVKPNIAKKITQTTSSKALSFEARLPSHPSLKPQFEDRMPSQPASINLSTTSPTTYHIYKTDFSHALITTHSLPKSLSSRRKYLEQNPDALSAPSTLTSPRTSSYFLHLPKKAFRCPPRTLRRGATKTSPPLCIVHNSPWWRRWRIMTGSELMGAIDPRGLVSWERRSSFKNRPTEDAEVKGYKTRRWRLWGESGKEFYRSVNKTRGARVRRQDQGQEQTGAGKIAFANELEQTADREMKTSDWDPVRADEVLPVTWTNPSPFSKCMRWYRFTYKDVTATWKGSRDIPANKKWGRRLMPVHHLKLLAERPVMDALEKQDRAGGMKVGEEIVLARYTSSLSGGKHGTLTIFDEEVKRVFGSQGTGSSRQSFGGKNAGVMDEYDNIVATAMCMVLGEWQKRNTVLEILLALLEAGADGGSGMT